MQKAVKSALLMHLGLIDDHPIQYPSCTEDVKKFYSSSQFHLSLSEKNAKDKEIINFLNEIPRGFRNSYCKNLTRYYLKKPQNFKLSDNKIYL